MLIQRTELCRWMLYGRKLTMKRHSQLLDEDSIILFYIGKKTKKLLYLRGKYNKREREIQSRPPLHPQSSLTAKMWLNIITVPHRTLTL